MLTDREREIVALVAGGLSNDEIAESLFISPATARTHVSRAMIKLGARDRAQLVVFAYESGLVAPTEWSGLASAALRLLPPCASSLRFPRRHRSPYAARRSAESRRVTDDGSRPKRTMGAMTSTPTLLAPPRPAVARAAAATKVYGSGDQAVRALDDVTVEIPGGRFTAIMGPSGSGKSTLMHCLAGLDTLTSGQVFLGDTELGLLSDRELTALRRERVGFVFQSFNLMPTLTAGRTSRCRSRSPAARPTPRQEWIDVVIRTVGLGDRLRHRPSELSGGQQQRVAIAGRWRPGPTSSSPTSRPATSTRRPGAEVLEFLRAAVRDMGQTVVMVTHDPVAAGYADSVVFLADGRIVGSMDQPTPERVLDALKTIGS